MMLDDGRIEKIRKGIYHTIVPETPGNIIEIGAVDLMYKLDRDYSASRTLYPATLQKIISDACLDCGIPIGFKQFDNMNFVIQRKPDKTTYRQVVSWAAQIAGYNVRIDDNGYLQLIWYKTSLMDVYNYNGGNFKTYVHDTIVDGGNFKDYSANTIISCGTFTDEMPQHIFRLKSISVHTDDVHITGIRVIGDDEKAALFGEEGYVIEIKENPFVNGKEQVVANYLGARMVGMVFRPFSADIISNPLYEPFEVVQVSDARGNAYLSIINSISYKIGAHTKIACLAEDPVRNGSTYRSPAAQAVVEARRNTEKKISTYDEAVQNMNQLAANAMGLFRASEKHPDGSYIYYQSNKPITVDEDGKCHFEENSVVYKNAAEGFFLSTDGGKSFTAGFDSQGNAVLNVLAAIGINADWINVKDLMAFNATIAGWKIQSNQIVKTINLYNDMTSSGLQNVGADDPVQYWVWIRVPTNETTPVFFVGYRKKSDFLNNVDSVYQIFSARTNGAVTANSFNSSNANITGGSFKVNSDNKSKSNIVLKYDYSNWKNILACKPEGIKFLEWQPSSGSRMISISGYSIGGGVPDSFSENALLSSVKFIIDSDGNASFAGNENRIIETQNYQNRLQYCYEMPSPMFGDIGTGETDDNGICYIFIDDIFRETIDTDCEYQVFLQKCGQGDIWIEEKTKDYFIVKGTPNLNFSWEIKAKQLGYEIERLEKFEEHKEEPLIDYEVEFDRYVKNFYKEALFYDSNN